MAVGLGAAAVAMAAHATLDGGDDAVLAALRAGSGLRIESNGRATVSVFPLPQVRVDGVSVAKGDEPPFVAARELVGSLRIGALLAGRIEFDEIALRSPQIELSRAPFDDLLAALRKAQPAAAAPALRISDGRIGVGGRTIEKVDAGMAWPGGQGRLSISGFGVYDGRPVEGTLTLADLAAFARGEQTQLRARMEGGGGRLIFDGMASEPEGPRFVGNVSARANSLRETLRWLDLPAPRRSAPLENFALTGRATADRSGLSIAEAELNLEGGRFFGAGRLRQVAGRASVEATLDTETLDLDPYVKGIAPALKQDGGWNGKAIDLANLRGFDLDLRLSTGGLRLGAFRFGQTAATVTIANGAFDASIGEAVAYGGMIGGRLSIEPALGAAKVRIEAAMTDVALDDALKRFVAEPLLSGALTGDFALEGTGRSVEDIVGSLAGQGAARLADGMIKGFGKSRTLSLAGLRGRMAVTRAAVRLKVEGGVARTSDLAIVGDEASLALSGDASIKERRLAFAGTVRPKDGRWTLPVKIEGPFSAPKLRPSLTFTPPRGEARLAKPASASTN